MGYARGQLGWNPLDEVGNLITDVFGGGSAPNGAPLTSPLTRMPTGNRYGPGAQGQLFQAGSVYKTAVAAAGPGATIAGQGATSGLGVSPLVMLAIAVGVILIVTRS